MTSIRDLPQEIIKYLIEIDPDAGILLSSCSKLYRKILTDDFNLFMFTLFATNRFNMIKDLVEKCSIRIYLCDDAKKEHINHIDAHFIRRLINNKKYFNKIIQAIKNDYDLGFIKDFVCYNNYIYMVLNRFNNGMVEFVEIYDEDKLQNTVWNDMQFYCSYISDLEDSITNCDFMFIVYGFNIILTRKNSCGGICHGDNNEFFKMIWIIRDYIISFLPKIIKYIKLNT